MMSGIEVLHPEWIPVSSRGVNQSMPMQLCRESIVVPGTPGGQRSVVANDTSFASKTNFRPRAQLFELILKRYTGKQQTRRAATK